MADFGCNNAFGLRQNAYGDYQMNQPLSQGQTKALSDRMYEYFETTPSTMESIGKGLLPMGSGMTLDKYLKDVMDKFNGQHFPLKNFIFTDIMTTGKWIDNIFPMIPHARALEQYKGQIKELGERLEVNQEWQLQSIVLPVKTRKVPSPILRNLGRRSDTRSYPYRGAACIIPLTFALDETQQNYAIMELQNMNRSIIKTIAYEVERTLVDEAVLHYTEVEMKNAPFSIDQHRRRMDRYRSDMFAVQKSQGFRKLEADAVDTLVTQSISPDYIMMSSKAMRYVEFVDPAASSHADTGFNSRDPVDILDKNGLSRTKLHSLKIVCSIPFAVDMEGSTHDPTSLICRFGLYYRMADNEAHKAIKEGYTHEMRDIVVMNLHEKRAETISFRDAIQADGLFNHEGRLDEAGRLAVLQLTGMIKNITLEDAERNLQGRNSDLSVSYERSYDGGGGGMGVGMYGSSQVTLSQAPWERYFSDECRRLVKDHSHLTTIHSYDGLPVACNARMLYAAHPGWLDRFSNIIRKRNLLGALQAVKGKQGQEGFYATQTTSNFGDSFGRSNVSGNVSDQNRAVRGNDQSGSANVPQGYQLGSKDLCSTTGLLGGVNESEQYGWDEVSQETKEQLNNISATILTWLVQADRGGLVTAQFKAHVLGLIRENDVDKIRIISEVIDKNIPAGIKALQEMPLDQALVGKFLGASGKSRECNEHEDICAALDETRIDIHFRNFCLLHDLPFPENLLLFQPDITCLTFAKVVFRGGADTGFVSIKDSEVTWVTDVNNHEIRIDLGFKGKLIIMTRRNLLFLPHTFVKGYVVGGGFRFMTASDYNQSKQNNNILPVDHGVFVVPDPVGAKTSGLICTPGDFHHEIVGQNNQPAHYAMAAYAVARYQFCHSWNLFAPASFMPEPSEIASQACLRSIKETNNTYMWSASWREFSGTTTAGTNGFQTEIRGETPLGAWINEVAASFLHGCDDAHMIMGGVSATSALAEMSRKLP